MKEEERVRMRKMIRGRYMKKTRKKRKKKTGVK